MGPGLVDMGGTVARVGTNMPRPEVTGGSSATTEEWSPLGRVDCSGCCCCFGGGVASVDHTSLGEGTGLVRRNWTELRVICACCTLAAWPTTNAKPVNSREASCSHTWAGRDTTPGGTGGRAMVHTERERGRRWMLIVVGALHESFCLAIFSGSSFF